MLAIHLRVNGMGGLQPKPHFSMFAKKTCFCSNALISVTKDRKTQKINYGLGCRPPPQQVCLRFRGFASFLPYLKSGISAPGGARPANFAAT